MSINIFVYQDGDYFVAKSVVEWVVSQWKSIQDAVENLKEALELYYEDEEFEVKTNIFTTTIEIPSIENKKKTYA